MATPGKTRPRHRWLVARRIVQCTLLLVFCAPLLVSGWALFGATTAGDDAIATPATLPYYGTLSSAQVGGIDLLDPFGALQLMAASMSFDAAWLIGLAPIALFYAAIGGRAFCGWVCPVNLFCEGVDRLRQALHLQVREAPVPRRAKVGVAIGILAISALIGIPVFEALSPISAINKGIVLGSLAGIVTLVAIVVLELFWGHRVWCRSLCPLGGFYQVLGKAGVISVNIKHDACIHCRECESACLADPVILTPALDGEDATVRAGDCMLCGKCVDACPTRALDFKAGAHRLSRSAKDSTEPVARTT